LNDDDDDDDECVNDRRRHQSTEGSPPPPYWSIEDIMNNTDDGLDLSLWMGDAVASDFHSKSQPSQPTMADSPTSPPIDFGKEWGNVETFHVHDDDESSRDSMDSVMFTESGDDDVEEKEKDDDNTCRRLWCHETQLESVSDYCLHRYHHHRIDVSESSLLDFMAMKHANVGGKECLKIQIAGGILGERFHYQHDEEGRPVPSYVQCASQQTARW
jgi:hypothetical protein